MPFEPSTVSTMSCGLRLTVPAPLRVTICPTDSPRMLALAAPGGEVRGAAAIGPLSFQFGGREFTEPEVATYDFGPASNSYGVRISGLLGYPLLRRAVVRINYRDGLLAVEQ